MKNNYFLSKLYCALITFIVVKRTAILKYYDIIFNPIGNYLFKILEKYNIYLIDAHSSNLGQFAPQFDYIIKTEKGKKLVFFVYAPIRKKIEDKNLVGFFPNSYFFHFLRKKNSYTFIKSIFLHTILHPIMWDKDQKTRGISFSHVLSGRKFVMPYNYHSLSNKDEEYKRMNEKDISLGYENLYDLGMKKDGWFYCLYSRDASYKSDPNNMRNADVDKAFKAAEYLNENGGYCVQVGSIGTKRFTITGINNIPYLDSRHKSDFMDVFLASQNRLFIGSTGGICDLARNYFNKFTAFQNYIPLTCWHIPVLTEKTVVLPKLIWSLEMDRMLTFIEQLKLFESCEEPFDSNKADFYKKNNLKIIDNDEYDILELVKQTYSLTKGILPKVNKRQKRFKTILKKFYPFELPDFCISENYLIKYEELLY